MSSENIGQITMIFNLLCYFIIYFLVAYKLSEKVAVVGEE
jgi:hypothetical protein